MRIDLSPFLQKKSSTCLPTCIRIVLHHFGIDLPEETLAEICKTTEEGTSLKEAAKALRSRGFEVIELKEADLFELFDHITRGNPIIVAVEVQQLPYGETGGHAVVICGFEKNEVQYIEPALGKEMSLDLLTFFKAWDALSRSGLIIYPKINSPE